MNYEFSEALSEQVQAARKEHGYTQDEVGELIGKTGKTISNIERGIANPEFDTIYLLFRLLEMDANLVVYPNKAEENPIWEQFQRLLAGCSDSELKLLFDVNRDILKHIRLRDEIRKTTTV